MINYDYFQREESRIIASLAKPEAYPEGRKRKTCYDDYTQGRITSRHYSYTPDVKLYAFGILLVLSVLLFLVFKGFMTVPGFIFTALTVIAFIIGLMGGFLFACICAGIVATIRMLFESYPLPLLVICIAAAAVLGYLVLKDYRALGRINTNYRNSELSKKAKEFREADKDFKIRLILELAKLCSECKATEKEFNASLEKLLKEFGEKHPGEVADSLYTDMDSMRRFASTEFKYYQEEQKKQAVREADIKREKEFADAMRARREREKAEEKQKIAEQPFLMYPESSFFDSQTGLSLKGRVIRGTVNIGDTLELAGCGNPKRRAVVTGIKTRSGGRTVQLQSATKENAEISILFKDLKKDDFCRGMSLAGPDSIREYCGFLAKIAITRPAHGGPGRTISDNYRGSFYMPEIPKQPAAEVHFKDGIKTAVSGDQLYAQIALDAPLSLETGKNFTILDDNTLSAADRAFITGTITDLTERG